MAINPLQTILPGQASPDRRAGKSKDGSTFGALLDTLRPVGDKQQTGKAQAAAELLRIEMMRSSLSLAGETGVPRLSGSPALAALLAGLAENGRPAGGTAAATAPPAELSSELQAELPAAADTPSAGAGSPDIGLTASRFLGIPYLFGGEGPSGIDCSSFVQQVFREHRITLPRTAAEQSTVGRDVARGDLREGDLVFFRTYASYPSHVGIYLGDGRMIHASSAKGRVVVSDMDTDYYRSRFLGAKRVT